jgi:hypothetical protein
MLAIAFLLVSLTAGFSLAYAIPAKPFRLEDHVFLGIPIGFAVGGLLTFVFGLLLGLSELTVALVSFLLLIGSIEAWFQASWRERLLKDWRDLRKRIRKREGGLSVLVFVLLAAMLAFIYWNSLFFENGELYVLFSNVWGDWAQHLAQINSFAHGNNLPPEFSYLSGHKITYPFLTNFYSAILIKGGVGTFWSIKLPGVLLAWAGLGLLMTFTRVTIKRGIWLVPLLFYFAGGLGFINFFTDLANSHQPLLQFLANQPHPATSVYDGVPITHLNWINTIFAYVVPQRAFLFGMPLLLGTVSLLYLGLKDKNKWLMLSAGLLACLLPLVHTHSLVFLGLFSAPMILLSWKHLAGRKKRHPKQLLFWLWFIGPILLVAIPQFLWLTTGTDTSKFIRFQYGWTKGSEDLLWFWLKNAGLFIPLILVGIFTFRKEPAQRLLVAMTLSAGFVWVLANLFVFQPWDWDNSKLLVYWFTLSLPIVTLLLMRWTDRGLWATAGVFVIILSLTLAGAADVSRALQPDAYKVQLFDKTGIEIGQAVLDRSPKDSVWLTSQQVNNPVSLLGGRSVVLGYTGNLWSYGLDFAQRERDVKQMFEGGPLAESLLKRYGVDFVTIGPSEEGDSGFTVNKPFYARYPVWGTFGPVTVYDVRAQPATPNPTASPAT